MALIILLIVCGLRMSFMEQAWHTGHSVSTLLYPFLKNGIVINILCHIALGFVSMKVNPSSVHHKEVEVSSVITNIVFLTQLKQQPKITSRKWQSTSHLIRFHGFTFCCWEWARMDTHVPSSQDTVFVMRPQCGLHQLLMPLNHLHQESRSPFQLLTMPNTVCLLLLEQQRLKW